MRNDLIIKPVKGMGRGVFAGQDFKKGDQIEICPVMVIARIDQAEWKGTSLEEYVFAWGSHLAIALGYGSLYNHSSNPNAFWVKNTKHNVITIIAQEYIEKGKQIFINYGYADDDYPFLNSK